MRNKGVQREENPRQCRERRQRLCGYTQQGSFSLCMSAACSAAVGFPRSSSQKLRAPCSNMTVLLVKTMIVNRNRFVLNLFPKCQGCEPHVRTLLIISIVVLVVAHAIESILSRQIG